MLLINSLIYFYLLIQKIGMICNSTQCHCQATQEVFIQHHSPFPPSLLRKGPSGKRSFTLRIVSSSTNFLQLLKNACMCVHIYIKIIIFSFSFRRQVLSLNLNGCNSLMKKLQHLFAFLAHTQVSVSVCSMYMLTYIIYMLI